MELTAKDLFAWKAKNPSAPPIKKAEPESKVLAKTNGKESKKKEPKTQPEPTNPKKIFKRWKNTPENWVPLELRKTKSGREALLPRENQVRLMYCISFNLAKMGAPQHQSIEMLLNMNRYDSEELLPDEKVKAIVTSAYFKYKEKANKLI